MIVRPALLPDLNACILLDHDTVTDHVWQMLVREESTQVNMTFQTVRLPRDMPAAYPCDPDQLLDRWQQGEGILVAEVDGEVRGYIDLVAEPWQKLARIANLAVDPEFRRRGLGTSLIRHARQWAWEQGLRSLLAEATTKNYPALCFYRKLGFKFCGFNDEYYANRDIALFFVQKLR
jgi:ribosomal protein S18 acetylase RimI-like enzyme